MSSAELVIGQFTPECPVPPSTLAAWNRDLAALAQSVTGASGERAGTLYAYWEPGEPWFPVGRFVVAQVTPRAWLERECDLYREVGEDPGHTTFAELEGPDPRDGGHYDVALGRFVHDPTRLPPSITQRQWQLWRDPAVGGLASPVWIVQGSRGGHKLAYNRHEQILNRLHGRPGTPPVPGSLPYAPVDQRTFRALEQAAHLARLHKQLGEDWLHKDLTPEVESRAPNAAERELLTALDAWLAGQVDQTLTTAPVSYT